MEGAAIAAKRAQDLAILLAWHSAAFERQDKLKSLSKYLGDREQSPSSKAAQALAWAHRMKARGVDITISKSEIN